ncbi:flagellar hook-associated protein 2 [Paenibacillus endophyticus]|uniref:Flagellar hook-associated protein 2 n=1 Tax=Paenibacillus endophyticus TaxID=1294268 RepID=A0A7W5CCJ6_9BACL|nr:flagellar filament capping protein FliD [Paenibacillus endophyticus]MBB3154634.1 flagellar hook-associated protein 2 [Paenibacillus endophyticus]
MRLSGLASGLDIDAMVKELMKAKRSTYDNMIKNRTKVEWQQEDYRSISTKIVDFRNNKLSSFNLSSAMSAKTSEISGDTAALTVNSTSPTALGSLDILVDEVATAANTVFKFNKGTTSTGQEKTLSELGFNITGGDAVIEINNVLITAKGTDTLSTLAKQINAVSGTAKATALYDPASGSFSITATKTGSTTDDGNGSTTNGLAVTGFASTDVTETYKDGKNARVQINGIEYIQANNRFSVGGIDFTVKGKTASGSSTAITTTQDTNKTIETIKSFVTEYNSLMNAVNSELSEARNRSFAPLTSEEKKELTDKEIEQWETKARSGTLRNDSTLSQLVSDLRTTVTSLIGGIVDGDGKKLSIGITTGGYTEKGKLVLDEAKLRTALESSPADVSALFTGTTGVFSKMSKSSMTALNSLSKKAGTSLVSTDLNSSFMENSALSTQIKSMKSRESSLLTRLDRMEDQYYKQFSAMESAINKFNSQSSTLGSFYS